MTRMPSRFDDGKNLVVHPNTGKNRIRRSDDPKNYGMGVKGQNGLYGPRGTHQNGRNKRSVWTIPTSSYPESHFATFPPDLIRPCIRAGCPIGGTVLDPFGGSGTTGQVALEEGRKAILLELNPDYIQMIKRRTDVTHGLPI